MTIGIVFFGVLFIKSLILLIGAVKRNNSCLVIYLVIDGIGILLLIADCFFLPLKHIVELIFVILIDSYAFAVVYSYADDVRD